MRPGWALWWAACGGAAAPPTVQVVEVPTADRPLGVLLAAEHETARAGGRCAIAQVYADWCGPCRELRAAMPDPAMHKAFRGVHLVRLELGAWDAEVRAQKPEINLPTLYEVLPDGGLGRQIDGGAWGENLPANMAPPLSAFLDEVCAGRR